MHNKSFQNSSQFPTVKKELLRKNVLEMFHPSEDISLSVVQRLTYRNERNLHRLNLSFCTLSLLRREPNTGLNATSKYLASIANLIVNFRLAEKKPWAFCLMYLSALCAPVILPKTRSTVAKNLLDALAC